MAQHHDTGSGTLATLVTGAVLGAAGLAWWLLNEADRRRRFGAKLGTRGFAKQELRLRTGKCRAWAAKG